jgi:hypothetical protein
VLVTELRGQLRGKFRPRPQILCACQGRTELVAHRASGGDIGAAIRAGLEVANELVVGLDQELFAQK